MLEVSSLQAGYGPLQVLWDVSIQVGQGEFVALIGPNGAGKTTTLRTIAGFLRPRGGSIRFMGQPIGDLPAHQISRLGISFISEDLNLFGKMTVRENLLLGAYTRHHRAEVRSALDDVLGLFPVLAQRQKQAAGTLSGGERKLLAIGRGLMARPRLVLVDEPSLGLAPRLAQEVHATLGTLHGQGVTILLVEQNVSATLHISQRGYVLERGRIVLAGGSDELVENAYLKATYLGVAQHG